MTLCALITSDKISDKSMVNNKGETWGHLVIMSSQSTDNLSSTIIISIVAFAKQHKVILQELASNKMICH